MGHVRWRGAIVTRKIRTSLGRSVHEIANEIAGEARRRVSVPQEPYPSQTAPAGEPPRKRTGELYGGYWSGLLSVKTARVGNSSKHALYTELGTAGERTAPSPDMSGGLTGEGGSAWITSHGQYPMRWIWWGSQPEFEFEKFQVKGQIPRPVLVPAAKASRTAAVAILKKNGF